MKRTLALLALMMFGITGCAGIQRDVSSYFAKNTGADWIVVQYAYDGRPINCWKLDNVAIDNEEQSDGIFWKESHGGHLVHISGWYNRVQVSGGRYGEAADLLGIELDKIGDGKYPRPEVPTHVIH